MNACGCGCSGNSTARNLRIGGQNVGIAEIDKILRKTLECPKASDKELKGVLLKELKQYNYVPSSMENEYIEALWQEYLRCKPQLMK
jgi:hypothetical protein